MKLSKKSNNSEELFEQIDRLKTFCGLGIQNSEGDNSNVDVKRAHKLLKKIIIKLNQDTIPAHSTTISTIQGSYDINSAPSFKNIDDIIKCCLILISNTISHLSMRKMSKQPIIKVRQRFREILSMLIVQKFDDVTDIVMNFLRDEMFCDGFVADVFKSLWSCREQCEAILDKILNLIEELVIVNRVNEARCIVKGLSKSIDKNLVDMSSQGLSRLLSLYHLSVEELEPPNKLYHLKYGFENSLLKIFNVMEVEELTKLLPKFLKLTFETKFMTELALKEFALTLTHAFMRLSRNKIDENLQPEIFEFLLAAMTLNCKTKSSLACRYLTHLLDHFNNFDEFSTPKIFYQGTPYKIKIPSESAIKFNDDHRLLIQTSLLAAIKLHGCITSNLCAIFKVICMMIVSLPSSHTFIMIITTLMQLQTFMLDEDSSKFTQVDKNHIHAFIVSIMTLICWVTRAKSLTKYINEIVKVRFTVAPHLNPPLKKFYEYEDHHVLNYKAELFLDKWEIRYCLWNRYKLNEDRLCDVSKVEYCKSENGNEKKKGRRFKKFHLFGRRSSEHLMRIESFPSYFEEELNKI
ncbi:unnamed protein product [Chironomus riparius]|uniref:Uncharacterized protein n=1 Tax=Chironomus riparius TaxID=315576 RepID=A0A9N9RQS0_9DIPT|nr:unnamed protein product [Chironomus riparius]